MLGKRVGRGGEGSHPLPGGRHCSPMAVRPLGHRAGRWRFLAVGSPGRPESLGTTLAWDW